jgi:5-methylcytosine-specific restriction endonuclease McrA
VLGEWPSSASGGSWGSFTSLAPTAPVDGDGEDSALHPEAFEGSPGCNGQAEEEKEAVKVSRTTRAVRVSRPKRQATCHPNRPAHGHGLCQNCYDKEWYWNPPPLKGRKRWEATCHPDRLHHANGLCHPCYSQQPAVKAHDRLYMREYSQRPEVKARFNLYMREYRLRRDGRGELKVDYAQILSETSTCYLCGVGLGDDIHFDHVVPLSRGGQHTYSNIKPTHPNCNQRKYNHLVSELDWAVGEKVSQSA